MHTMLFEAGWMVRFLERLQDLLLAHEIKRLEVNDVYFRLTD